MDYSYMSGIMLRVLVLAPAMILLALLAFIGVLMLLEKSGLFAMLVNADQNGQNGPPGGPGASAKGPGGVEPAGGKSS